jgi:predicted RNA-binding Zn-ribbon protein involved in translation (DUF1610 family)
VRVALGCANFGRLSLFGSAGCGRIREEVTFMEQATEPRVFEDGPLSDEELAHMFHDVTPRYEYSFCGAEAKRHGCGGNVRLSSESLPTHCPNCGTRVCRTCRDIAIHYRESGEWEGAGPPP